MDNRLLNIGFTLKEGHYVHRETLIRVEALADNKYNILLPDGRLITNVSIYVVEEEVLNDLEGLNDDN